MVSIVGGIALGGCELWETVVRLAAHGSRKVGGTGHCESKRTRLRFRDSMTGDGMDTNGIYCSVHVKSSKESSFLG